MGDSDHVALPVLPASSPGYIVCPFKILLWVPDAFGMKSQARQPQLWGKKDAALEVGRPVFACHDHHFLHI